MKEKDPDEANCISPPSPSSPVSDPWDTEELKNNISISLWLQRYKMYKSPPSSPHPHLSHSCSQTHGTVTLPCTEEGLKRAVLESVMKSLPSAQILCCPRWLLMCCQPLRSDLRFWEFLNLVTTPRCCGMWLSEVWKAQVQRLWQKAWQWCVGPRACLRTAPKTGLRS